MTMRIVTAIADALADPERVAAVTTRPGNELVLSGRPMRQWQPVGLSDAHPAVSLLFAELGAADPAQWPRAHAHLAAALAAPAPPPLPALYAGAVSLAFAAHAAALATGGYATLLDRLDGAVAGQARQRAATLRARLDAGEPIGEWSGYDVVTGATGVGRHLLARRDRAGGKAAEEVGAALRDMLDLLVRLALTGDATAGDRRVPAWWVRHDPAAEHAGTAGHLNLGLAHGVPGPLALLALAWRAGVRVDRHAEAAAAMAALLTDLRREDAAGPYWPNWTGSGADERLRRVRDVWCYGAAGLGRALYLAGTAFGEKDWTDTAEAAVRGAFATAGEHSVRDYALCHGWAGLLQIACRMAHDTGDPAYAVAADGFADRIRAGHDPGLPFGYRYAHAAAARDTDRPGLLEGAAGIALALHCHATGAPPATGWDAALLLD